MRKRIFEIIEVYKDNDSLSRIYDIFMIIVISMSLLPLCFKDSNVIFDTIEFVAVVIFIIDYLARLLTADYKLNKGNISFIIYPFSFLAILDLISILPSFISLNLGFKLFKTARLFKSVKAMKAFKAFKAFKGIRYSKNVEMIYRVLVNQKDSLITVGVFALCYVFISALIIFNVEPETFSSFFDAIYWATVSLTTVGYGDIYPVSLIGKIVTMISSLLGIAIVALPAGILTAGYMNEIENEKKL